MRRKRAGSKSFAVFGMGKFGKNVAIELAKNGADVLAVDSNEEALGNVIDYVTEAVVMDVTDTNAYSRISIAEVDAVIIAMAEHMDATIMAIMQSEEAGVELIIVKALDEFHSRIYEKVGATRVIIPEMVEGIGLARALTGENTFDYIDLSSDACIAEVLPHESWIGKSLQDLDLINRHGINVIGIIKDDKVNLVMAADKMIGKEEHLLIATTKKNFENIFGKYGVVYNYLNL